MGGQQVCVTWCLYRLTLTSAARAGLRCNNGKPTSKEKKKKKIAALVLKMLLLVLVLFSLMLLLIELN